MKKKIILLTVMTVLLTGGCKAKEKTKEEKILGTWETQYELSVFGQITEGYSFKEDGKCVRMLNTGTDIANNCTYEMKEDEIRIIWDDKLDKETYSRYLEIDEDTIMIGEHKYIRKK